MPLSGAEIAEDGNAAVIGDDYYPADSSSQPSDCDPDDVDSPPMLEPDGTECHLPPPSLPQESFAMSDASEDEQEVGKSSTAEPPQLLRWELQLLRCAKEKKFDEANELLENNKPTKLVVDKKRRTAAHYAGMTTMGMGTLKNIVKHVGNDCMEKFDYHRMTPLHYAAACYNTLEPLMEGLTENKKLWMVKRRAETGDTVAHFAAINRAGSNFICTIAENMAPACFHWKNNKGQGILHLVAVHGTPETLDKILSIIKKKYQATERTGILKSIDEHRDTYLHYAVCNPRHNAEIVDKMIPRYQKSDFCMLYKQRNEIDQTVLQSAIISESCVDKTAQQIVQQLSTTETDTSRQNKQTDDIDILRHRDRLGNTALFYAVQHRKLDTAIELMKQLNYDSNLLESKNRDEQTVVHLAFKHKELTYHLKTQEKSKYMYNKAITNSTLLNGSSRTVLFYACLGWNFGPLFDILSAIEMTQEHDLHDAKVARDAKDADDAKKKASEILKCTDLNGNTLLHAIFLNEDYVEKPPRDRKLLEFFRAFGNLLQAGVDPMKENNLGQNCLHASILQETVLCRILNLVARDKSKPVEREIIIEKRISDTFKDLLWQQNGFHVVHSFASKYSLAKVEKQLARLTEMSEKNLLSLKVSKGPLEGSTCLHLACEAGYKENISYLTGRKEYLKTSLATKSEAGLTCIDFALKYDKIDQAIEALKYNGIKQGRKRKSDEVENDELKEKGESKQDESKQNDQLMMQIFRLIDPPCKSLAAKLPSDAEACQLLASMRNNSRIDGLMSTSSPSDGWKSKDLNLHGDQKNAETEVTVLGSAPCFPHVDVLLKAVASNSRNIFRSGLKLGLLSHETEIGFYYHELLELKRSPDGVIQCSRQQQQVRERSKHDKSTRSTRAKLNLSAYHDSSEMVVIDVALSVHRQKFDLLIDLILTRQFELIPVCLSLLVQLRPMISRAKDQNRDTLRQLRSNILSTAVNALDELFACAHELGEKNCLTNYIAGEISDKQTGLRGPKFPCRTHDDILVSYKAKDVERESNDRCHGVKYLSILQMAERADRKDLFGTDCFHHVVKRLWKKYSDGYYWSAESKYWAHLVSFVLFIIFFAWYLIDFGITFDTAAQGYWTEVLMAAYLLSFTVQEVHDMHIGRKRRSIYFANKRIKCPAYFRESINLFDCTALILMWIGLIWKWAIFSSHGSSPTTFTCQMILSTSFLLWGFRSVSFLSYFELTGPVISMIRSLLIKDLLPFAAIVLVIFYSFSVFFFNLLFPVVSSSERNSSDYSKRTFIQIATLPFVLFLTEPPNYKTVDTVAGSNQTVGLVAHPEGDEWFTYLLQFVFLLLVNIVMVNLLIALFSLRVSQMLSRARCIWRRKFFHLQIQFRKASPLPPPLSFLYFILPLIVHLAGCGANKKVAPEVKPWWKSSNGESYPEEYLKYLKFQAIHLRHIRPKLQNQLEKHQSDIDGLKAFTGNYMTEMQRELNDALQNQEDTLRKLDEKDPVIIMQKKLEKLEADNLTIIQLLKEQQQQQQQPSSQQQQQKQKQQQQRQQQQQQQSQQQQQQQQQQRQQSPPQKQQ